LYMFFDRSEKENNTLAKQVLMNLLRYLRFLGGPFFLLATLAYGLQNLVNTELIILLYVYALLGLAIYVPMILTDQVSLAYAAYAGIGGYSVAILSSRNLEALWGVLLGVALAGLTAYLVALATKKLSGYFLAVGTLLVAVAFGRFLLQQADLTGGGDGLTFRREILGLSISRTFLLIIGAAMIWLIATLIQNLRRSDLGKGLFLMGGSRPAAESIGLNTPRFRILSLVLGAAIASLAGSLLAFSRGLVLPDSFHLELAFLILFIPLLGGKQTPWGCLLGAALLIYVLEIVRSFGPGKLLYGIGVLACVLFIPGGIAGRLGALLSTIERWMHLHLAKSASVALATSELQPSHTELSEGKSDRESEQRIDKDKDRRLKSSRGETAPLVAKDMNKTYGGVTALQDVSFELLNGEILGIVGPNGAGKTTLIDVLTGIQSADSGQVLLEGQALEGVASDRALAGLSRTFQHPQLSTELTVGENVGLGLFRLRAPRSWTGMTVLMIRSMLTFLRNRKGREDEFAIQGIALRVGLQNLNEEVGNVSFGIEKLTEIGRALISKPPVLLMDEPFAGLGKTDIDRVIDAIERWRPHALGVIIVDHNIDLLSKICDRLLVLDSGAVIACGPPYEVLSEPHVQKAYFGGE
jgi:ABC-type branched-subunit amino acid transport system ATPase component/ABC-type branched-subunit amino acid transport system permease subunit